MRKSYQGKHLRRLAAAVCGALVAGMFTLLPNAEALRGGVAMPILDAKDAAVSIATTDNVTMNITSGELNNLIKWVDFSIGAGGKVAFDGNNYLNYVTGSARSDILGTLTGGGSIYLVNPNGILIGDNATINVGNLYLSTRNLSEDVLNAFSASGANPLQSGALGGDVINLGKLDANSVTVEGKNITFKNVAEVTAATVNVTSDNAAHVGFSVGDEATTVNDEQYKNVTEPTLTGWTFNKTPDKYMLVRNGYELQNMQNNLSGKYMLAGDINASSINGFTPIGKLNDAFTGKFDGLDYKLTGLKVTPINGLCGLFGQNNGTIENLEIGGITVVSNSYNQHYVGTVAGYNNGTIRNVRNTGDIAIDFAYNDSSISIAYIGGIVAWNYGTIQNAYNSGEISVDNAEDMGGIAGRNDGKIASVFNSGSLTGNCGGENYMGGIAGLQYGTITDAYNSGAITNQRGDGYTGGIVGSNRDTVNRTYNCGTLTGGANLGGIAGGGWGSVENSYYLDTIEPAGAGSSKGTAKSADELRQAETFASWGSDISAVGSKNATWRIYDGNSNPLLTAFMTAKDNYQGTSVYNGEETGDVGANYRDSTYSSTAEQIGGINYVNDYTIVTPKALTVTNVNKTYDGTDTATIKAANLSGVVTGDTLTVSTTSANYADKNAATGKTVTYGGLTLSGAKAKNYTIDASGTTTGNISPKEITATFADIAKTYDGTTNATAGQGTLAGVVDSDTGKVSVSGLAAYDTKNAGTRTVNYTNVALSGAEAANYTIADTATGSGTITAKELSATFADIAKTYDGTTNATAGQGTLAGVVDSDTGKVSVSGLAAYDTKNAGTRTVNYTNVALSGAEAANYTIADTATGSGTITAKELSATFADIAKTYDGTTNATAGQGTLAGVVENDDVNLATGLIAAYADKNAGTNKTVNYAGLALSGTDAGNYTIGTTAEGKGTITAKQLTATFADIAKTYDGTTNATTGQGTLTGVETIDEGKVSVSGLAAYDTKNAGNRTVNYTNVALSGAEAANYTIADTATGSGTISKADVKISVDNYSRAYDGTTDASGATLKTVDGTIFAGDTLSGGTLAFTDKNAGTGKTITVSDVTVNDGNGGNNYNVTYESGTGTITAKELDATFADITKTYDGTTNATAGQGTLAGVVENDDVNLATGLTAAYADKNAGTNKTVNYAGLALSGTDAGNYTIGTTAEGKGTITAKQLTATFADIAKTYDGTTNATAGQGTLAGMVASDEGKVSVSGLAAYDTKNAGTRTVNYTNVALSGAEAANYIIADTATGSGTISKADVKISVDNYSRTYDGTTDASGATLKTVDGAIFAGDTLSGGTFAFTDKNAGTGKTITVSDVTVNDGNGGNNYNVTYQEGTGEITRRPLSLTANPVSITQGEAVPASFSGTLTGFAEGEGLAEGDSYAFNLSGTPTAVGKYAITGTLSIGDNDPAESGNYGTNYTFDNAATNATAFTIAAKYVPPAPTPTPSAPSGGNGGNTGNTGGNTGSTTPTNPTTPTEPTPIAPSGNTDSTTPNSGGNTSGTGANPPAPLAAAERVIVATVTETETIAAAATAGATTEMSHIADNVRPMSLTEQPTNSGENAAAAPLAAAVETAANAQDFTLTAGGLLAVSNETNSAPKDAMSVESIGHALSVLQHGSGEKSAATAPNTETKSAAGSIGSLEEAVEATDLAIGTEIAETDRESKAGQENLASDTGTAGGADESAEESDEKKKR